MTQAENTQGTRENLDDAMPVIDLKAPPAVVVDEDTFILDAESEKTEPVAETQTEEKPAKEKHNVIQSQDNELPEIDEGPVVMLPGDLRSVTSANMDEAAGVDMLSTHEQREWAEAIKKGVGLTSFREAFVPALSREGSEFTQGVAHQSKVLRGVAAAFANEVGQVLSGDRAILRLITQQGLGTVFRAPMWASGFWVTFRPPMESELIDFNDMIANDKITLGRMTYGMIFANTSAYMIDRLLDFAIAHVYDITINTKEFPLDQLKDVLLTQDIPSFIWGFICTMYPRGFRYRRACVDHPDKCHHIAKGVLNVQKLQYTDSQALTPWQKQHMSFIQAKSRSIADVRRYQEETQLTRNLTREITTGAAPFRITHQSPSARLHVDTGHSWIGDVVTLVDEALGSDAALKDRNALINRHAKATALRQYQHWISEIEFNGQIVRDPETLSRALAYYSSSDSIRKEILKSTTDYINASQITVIGLPTYNCPQCKKPQDSQTALPYATNLIPLDIYQLFFVLLYLKLEAIDQR